MHVLLWVLSARARARARARPALVSVGPPALTHKARSLSPTSARASMTAAVFFEYARFRYDFDRFYSIFIDFKVLKAAQRLMG